MGKIELNWTAWPQHEDMELYFSGQRHSGRQRQNISFKYRQKRLAIASVKDIYFNLQFIFDDAHCSANCINDNAANHAAEWSERFKSLWYDNISKFFSMKTAQHQRH